MLAQRSGRRRAIGILAMLALPAIPLWLFSHGVVWLATGGFLIQVCVQGAWGVVPAYLNELSPPAIRATFPGLTYQLGNLIASPNLNLQLWLAGVLGGLDRSIALVLAVVAVLIAALATFGPDTSSVRLGRERR